MAKKKQKLLRIKLVRSPIGYTQRQKETVRSLGLRRMNQVVEKPDTQMVRGMVAKIPHLVEVEEVG
jgi:large subunit ribosomal protein L30